MDGEVKKFSFATGLGKPTLPSASRLITLVWSRSVPRSSLDVSK
jgi:hypothetical protein